MSIMPSKSTKARIESLLLVAYKPLPLAVLVKLLKVKESAVSDLVKELAEEYLEQERGFEIIFNNKKVQLVSSRKNSDLVRQYTKDETTGEMTPASIETLTIVAYRQPVSKAELEQIRGVNCSLILRNLMIRGLVEAQYDRSKGATVYNTTHDFLKFLGIASVAELPDYTKLNSHESLQKMLNQSGDYAQTEANEDKVVKVEVKGK